jgi:uncharacterized repeat protein (TIGR03803 family)
VFKLNKDGTDYLVLHSFDGLDGGYPNGLVQGRDGRLYGATYVWGSIFALNGDGTGFAVLHTFLGWTAGDGDSPLCALAKDGDGALFGTTSEGGTNNLGTVFRLNADGSSYAIVHSFNNGDAKCPLVPPIEGSDGALYGTSSSGGADNLGSIYRLNRDGTGYSVLHSFDASNGGDATGALVEGSNGALYGSAGSVFRLNKDGSDYRVLYGLGVSALLADRGDAVLYGFGNNNGAVLKLNEDGSSYSVLYQFGTNAAAGHDPSSLILGTDGVFYGTSAAGGATNADFPDGMGTVFRLNKDGSSYAVLHKFVRQAGYNSGSALLVEGSDGALYGATPWSVEADWGSVFKLRKDGSGYSVLHRFSGVDVPAGAGPVGLVEGSDGALYGTTAGDCYSLIYSTLFRLSKDGTDYSVLYTFGNGCRGSTRAGLLKGSNGAFYGTTCTGGDISFGSVFRLWPPETPDMVGVAMVTNTVQVTFTGVSGYQYQVLRSTDLTNWAGLGTITMPPSGIYALEDKKSVGGTAYYRAAWVSR